jgi:hypothetical protein
MPAKPKADEAKIADALARTEQSALLEACLRAIPYPHQIKALNLGEPPTVRFSWRDASYRVSTSGYVEEADRGMLIGTDRAILMGALISRAIVGAA